MRTLKKLVLIAMLVVLSGYGVLALLRGPARGFAAAILGKSASEEEMSGPSFTDDTDRDGLSDAKEAIYGTSADKPDTDGDGFTDGEEIGKGFDPTIAGEAKITDNTVLMANLTVRYFEWARTVARADDPQLNDEAVRQFLATEDLLDAKVAAIDDGEIVKTDASGADAIRAYFNVLAQIALPEETASFLDVADEVVRTKQSEVLDTVISGLNETYNKLRAVPAPPETVELHREQLGLIKTLKNLFTDLYGIERDPVMLVRDIAWGDNLLTRAVDLEMKRLELAASVGLTQPAPAEEPTTP